MRNIAIIGGGFYGCYIASKLKKFFNVTIYERNADILQEAISNNQHRLHLGFHYPRSVETINQTIVSFNSFKNQFPNCSFFYDDNIYLVHNNSKVSFDDYCKIFNSNYFNVKDINDIDVLNNSSNYQGAIQTKEEVINLKLLKTLLRKRLRNVSIKTNISIDDVLVEELKNKYDYVINSTYFMPKLGTPNTKFKFKYELCILALVRIEQSLPSITIMDGDFISLYPTEDKNIYTLSSVKYTPIKVSEDINEIIELKNNLDEKKYSDRVINHCKKFIDIEIKEVVKNYVAIKCKPLWDKNATRESFIFSEDNCISMYCGKISCITDIYNKIEKIVK